MVYLLPINHRIMAEKIAAELDLSPADTQSLVSGSLGPDSHADFPHATGKDGKILYNLDNARALFLENDDYCYGELGNALHYIQDKWSNNNEAEKTVALVSDEALLKHINQSETMNDTQKNYLETVNMLLKIKKSGIESWFNHSWGFFHRDFSSCIYLFADILELMLPSMKPEISTDDTESVKAHIQSEAFKTSIKDGLIFSVKNNFLKPKLSGYPAAVYLLALTKPPAKCSDALVNLNIAFRLSLELARLTLLKPERFQFVDNWTQRGKLVGKKIGIINLLPQYHVLIPQPAKEVYKTRKAHFDEERKRFLANWAQVKHQSPTLGYHSEIWKLLLTIIVDLLNQDNDWTEQLV